MIDLSKRLATVAKQVQQGSIVADIGSDHAYLPIYLIQNNQIEFSIAGEIARGPYERAVKEVDKHQLTNKIDVRLGNGLDVLEPSDHVDTLTICGMGGVLIKSILERALSNEKIHLKETLILQPNVGEAALRNYLMTLQYEITEEFIIEENHRIYEIIVAEPSKSSVNYSTKEIQFGPYLMKEKSNAFIKKWKFESEKLTRIIEQLEKSKEDQTIKINQLNKQLKDIEERLQ